jgi:tripartite-type tricarboxylate transporter receptor subunit TctC
MALAVALSAVALSAGVADAADNGFYAGKQIELLSGSEPPGVYDAYVRLLAKYMPKYIPGQPTIVVQYMPGAGGIKVTNYIANIAPRDGTVFAGTIAGAPTAALMTPDVAKFDINKLSWIGSAARDPYIGYVWHSSKIQTLEDAKKMPSTMGGTSAGTAGVDMVILADAFFGFKFKLVAGYQTSADVKLAMEKGELDGTFANAWSDLKTLNYDWVRDGKVRIIVQHGFAKDPALPGDAPLFIDQAKTDADRQALYLMLARQEASKPFFASPDLPPGRLDILRHAFDAAIKDPGFVQDATAAHLSVDGAMTGDELAQMVTKLSATPTTVVERVKTTLANYHGDK